MAHYTVTHSCGHEERVSLVGKQSLRDWKLARMAEEQCFDCYKAARLVEAQQEAQEQELPALHGTLAQVAWAETLRIGKLKDLEKHLENQDNSDPVFLQAVDAVMQETSAHQWIEWRYTAIERILRLKMKALEDVPPVAKEKPPIHQAVALGEATLRPEKPRTETVAEIRIDGDTIAVIFSEKRDDFRELVRFKLGYEWKENRWQRTINPLRHGTVQDRASEVGRVLLAAGFSVRCFDEAVRAKALSGEFAPECTRWISKRKNTSMFYIQWGRDEDFYNAARKLSKRSSYDKPGVLVPSEAFEAVLDFAEMYGFQLSEGAKELVEQARITKDNMLVVKVDAPEQIRKPVPGEKPGTLDVPEQVEVLDEFKEGA